MRLPTSSSRAAAVVLAGLLSLLTGCAQLPMLRDPGAALADHLFDTRAFAVPDATQVFAMSDEMRLWADEQLTPRTRHSDPRRMLIEALYGERALRYDASHTRNAAEAFQARAGNCLSLVIMTASFARHLNLPLTFQRVLADEMYTREGALTMVNGHVNLVLSRNSSYGSLDLMPSLTVDFVPPAERRGNATQAITERTIVAMFQNNRAAEALVAGELDEAYAWARAAVLQDPAFHPSLNTLAVIYRRAGHQALAENTLRGLLREHPRYVAALVNLVELLRHQGRTDEAAPLALQLAALQPTPPFHHHALGMAALEQGRWDDARREFLQELRLQPFQHEVHHALAQALWRLGDTTGAIRHLGLASDYSTTMAHRGRYAAKLQHLRSETGLRLQ